MGLFGGNKRSDQPQRRRTNATYQAVRQPEPVSRGQNLFRRNRTLVGSLSMEVRSAGELSGDLRSPRAHVHHLTAHRRMVVSILLVVVAATCLLVWLLYEFTAGIHVTATDGVPIDSARYQRAITDYFAGHPLERLRVLCNDQELAKYLERVTPEVTDAKSKGAYGFVTTQFDLTFRRPVASWLIGSTQNYVDESGVSFQKNYYDNPGVKIVDQSGVPQAAGTALASGRFLRFVGRTVSLAKVDGLTINQAIIPANTTHQIEVNITGHKYPVMLSLDRPVGEQVEDMMNAVKYFDARSLQPQYLDVRVSGRAYYK